MTLFRNKLSIFTPPRRAIATPGLAADLQIEDLTSLSLSNSEAVLLKKLSHSSL